MVSVIRCLLSLIALFQSANTLSITCSEVKNKSKSGIRLSMFCNVYVFIYDCMVHKLLSHSVKVAYYINGLVLELEEENPSPVPKSCTRTYVPRSRTRI